MKRSVVFRTLPAIIVTVMLVTGCDQIFDQNIDHVSRAEGFIAAGDEKAAVVELKNTLQLEPKNARARLLLGMMESSRGNWNAAIKELNLAQGLGVPSAQLLLPLARAYLETGQHQRMLLELLPANFPGGPERALAINLRAAAMVALGRFDDADASYAQVLQLDPANLDATVGRGTVASLQGDYQAARGYFDSALAISPDKVGTWVLIGNLEFRRRNLDSAEQAFRRALQIHKDDLKAQLGLAMTLIDQGNMPEVRELTNQLEKAHGQVPAFKLLMASIAYDEKDYARVTGLLEPVLVKEPGYQEAVLLLGVTYFVQGQYQQAQTLLKQYLAAHPGHLRARLILAAAQTKSGLKESAVKTLKPALAQAGSKEAMFAMAAMHLSSGERDIAQRYVRELIDQIEQEEGDSALIAKAQHQTDSQSLSRALQTLSQAENLRREQQQLLMTVIAQLERREYVQALQAFDALDESPMVASMGSTIRGVAHAGMGQKAIAREEFGQALAVDPENLVALAGLASIDLQEGNLDAADAGFETVLTLAPLNRPAALALARIAQERGDPEQILGALSRARAIDPSNATLPLAIAALQFGQGRKVEAERMARIAYALDPERIDIKRLLARVLMDEGDYRAAKPLMIDLINRPLPPADDPAAQSRRAKDRVFLASMLDASGDAAMARKTLLDGVAELPGYVPFYSALVALGLRVGDVDQAMAAAQQLQSVAPESPDGYALEGDVRRSQGDLKAAIEAYRRALPWAETGQSARSLAKTLVAAKRPDEARVVLAERLKAFPDDVVTRGGMASLLMLSGDGAAAREEYLRVLEADPENPLALNQLALLEQRDGRLESALDYARRALKRAPGDPLVGDTLGWLLVKSGDIEDGLGHLRSAHQALPNHPEITYHLAAGLAEAGENQRAKELLQSLPLDQRRFAGAVEAQDLLDRLGAAAQ